MSRFRMVVLLLCAAVASAGAGLLGERRECSEWHSRYQAGLDADIMKNGIPYQVTQARALDAAGPLPPRCERPPLAGQHIE